MKLRTIIIDDERPSIEGLIWELKTISEETLPGLRKALQEAGAPWIEGEGLD